MVGHTENSFSTKPVISYPSEAELGKVYLMTIDLEPSEGVWSFGAEEYIVYCKIDAAPYFNCQPLNKGVIVLHRFGGSYGPAKILLTASSISTNGSIKISFVNQWGVPIAKTTISGLKVRSSHEILTLSERSVELSDHSLASGIEGDTNLGFPSVTPVEEFLSAEVDTIETGAIVTGLPTLMLNTMSEVAKAEGGSTLAKWLNKDISAALEQQVYHASDSYLKNYQERHGKLKVVCVRMDTPMKLDKLYTAVRVLERSELTYFESIDGLLTQYRKSGRRGFQRELSEKRDGIDIANQEQFLMVLGEPGIGKSTLLRKVGLEALKGKEGTYAHNCVPVFLPLQRFKDVSVSVEQRIIQEFETCGFPEPAAITAAMLKKGRLLVLLDGLDEVPKNKDVVIEQIRDFVDAHSNNRFIASCRVAAYKGGLPQFKDVAIAPFEDEQIEQFIHNWFSSEKNHANSTANRCWEFLQRPDCSAIKELAQTPILLALLCAVYEKQQAFPKNRASLYREALDVVLKEWAAEKRIHNDPIYLDLPLELERDLLAELAFDSFEDDQLFFDRQNVAQRIKEFLVSNLNAPRHLDSEAVLEAIEVQQGVLTERARDAYSFSHLTFQEYLTAQRIIDTQQAEWLVNNHIADKRWREVFILVVGLWRGKGADSLLQLMETKCNENLRSEPLRSLVGWAEEATNNSHNPSKPAARRAAAVFLALSLNPFRSNQDDLSRTHALNLVHNLNHNLVSSLVNIRDYIHVQNVTSIGRVNCDMAKAVQHTRLFDFFDCEKLSQEVRQLQRRLEPVPQITEEQVLKNLLECWSSAIQFDLEQLVELSENEARALEQYLYSLNLIVQCKDAAMRISPKTLVSIEDRLLTIPI